MASVVNIPMYFRLAPEKLDNEGINDKLRQLGELCIGGVTNELTELSFGNTGNKLFVFTNEQTSHVFIGIYKDGLITVDIQHYGTDLHQYNMSYIRSLEQKIVCHLNGVCHVHNSLHCPIRRGQTVWPYAVSADERLLELDHDALVYETTSRWQTIRIYHSRNGGNVLLLDGDAMLGEGDLIYTQTLCLIGQEDFHGKRILVLGGGDGGILHELLKEGPEFITVAEIDEEVIKACRVYMRGACGDSLDKMEGPNYKIVIDDCLAVLKDNIDKGVEYDYVINDLTEFPVDKLTQGYDYDFNSTSSITRHSLDVLKSGGKMFARGNCIGAVDYRDKFEAELTALSCQFVRRDVYVPSFHEVYCFYEISKKNVHVTTHNEDLQLLD